MKGGTAVGVGVVHVRTLIQHELEDRQEHGMVSHTSQIVQRSSIVTRSLRGVRALQQQDFTNLHLPCVRGAVKRSPVLIIKAIHVPLLL